ncbi:MAG: hypothetical protein KA313_06460 [Pseudarcicella sp.]|nr:hypothetical protein [Pseudarcicella sp.]
MKKYKYIILAFLSITVFSCDMGGEPEIGGTGVKELSGEWWVEKYDINGEFKGGYDLITTSSTAKNSASELLFYDQGHFGGINVKLNSDLTNFTFSGTNVLNQYVREKILNPRVPLGTIDSTSKGRSISSYDLKIYKNKIKTLSNVISDSISIKVETAKIEVDFYKASSYNIEKLKNGKLDTTVNWTLQETKKQEKSPFYLRGYKRTGFLEDEH